MKKSLLLLCVSIFTMTLVSPRYTHACSCSSGYTPSALDMFESADHVVIAKVIFVKTAEEDTEKQYDSGDGSAVMTVEKIYKGGLKSGEEIEFPQRFTSCDMEFKKEHIGQKYLFYLAKPLGNPPRYRYGGCGMRPAGIMEYAIEDILYLDNLYNLEGKTRISGILRKSGDDSNIKENGRKILIRQGGKTWEAFTDSNGVFEIYGLPAGEYELMPELLDGWKIDTVLMHQSVDPGRGIPVTLKERRHVSQSIWILPGNVIRGRLLSSSGQPLRNVLMTVGPIDGNPQEALFDGGALGRTDINGEFNFSVRANGEYILYLHSSTVDEDIPFGGMIYYPGVTKKEEAKVFSITPGAVFDDLSFSIPK